MVGPRPADEDELELGSRVAWRWWLVAAGVLVSAVVALVVVDRTTGSDEAVRTTAPATEQPASPLGPALGDVPGLGAALELTSDPVNDVAAASGHRVWVLQSGHLSLIGAGAGVSALLPVGRDEIGTARLVLDLAADRLWVVVEDRSPAHIVEFEALRLERLWDTYWDREIQSAAALDGRLYLATGSGIAVVAPGAQRPQLIGGPRLQAPALAVDPARDRLLIASSGSPTWLFTLRRGVTLHRIAQLGYVKVSLAVTGSGAIWAAGFRRHGAALQRLDPATLRPLVSARLADQLGPGAQVVAAGARSVWVRSGVGGDPRLWCLDAGGGRTLQMWTVGGNVASTAANAVIAAGGQARTMRLRGCRG